MIIEQVIENDSLSKIEGKLVRWLEQPGGLKVKSVLIANWICSKYGNY